LAAGYTRISRVGRRRGDGFISEDDQREGISRRCEELGLGVAERFHDDRFARTVHGHPVQARSVAFVARLDWRISVD